MEVTDVIDNVEDGSATVIFDMSHEEIRILLELAVNLLLMDLVNRELAKQKRDRKLKWYKLWLAK